MVLYMFNPFGAATMQKVLDTLQESLQKRPRHTVVILLWPQCEDLVARVEGMRLIGSTRRFKMFEAHHPDACDPQRHSSDAHMPSRVSSREATASTHPS